VTSTTSRSRRGGLEVTLHETLFDVSCLCFASSDSGTGSFRLPKLGDS
jgi:hypothetical protein